MILDALIASLFFGGFVAVLAIPWMGVPTYQRSVSHGTGAQLMNHHD